MKIVYNWSIWYIRVELVIEPHPSSLMGALF